jgi:hypothetical protein
MYSFDKFVQLSLQEKIDYLSPLFLALPDWFQNSKIIFAYISRWNPSSLFLDNAYNQILDYIKVWKLHSQELNLDALNNSIMYVKNLRDLEVKNVDDAEKFLLEWLSSL